MMITCTVHLRNTFDYETYIQILINDSTHVVVEWILRSYALQFLYSRIAVANSFFGARGSFRTTSFQELQVTERQVGLDAHAQYYTEPELDRHLRLHVQFTSDQVTFWKDQIISTPVQNRGLSVQREDKNQIINY